jgi:uncharacterized protein involved in type VI secretion and phage assembly
MTASRARTLDKRYYGVADALVEEVENDPDGEGKIKISYPWFDDSTVSDWVPVRQLYAGNGYGAFFIPEKGTHVLVAFVHGDMRRPVVLGGLYNGKDKPPVKRTNSDDHKLIRTKYGHQIDLNDSPGKEGVDVTTKNGHELLLSDEKALVTLTTKSGLKATFDQNANSVTITTPGGDKVVIDGNSKKVTVSSMTVVLSGSSVKLGGEGAAQSVMLGDLFLSLFNAHVHTCTAPGAPSTPPVPPIPPIAVLSQIVKTT